MDPHTRHGVLGSLRARFLAKLRHRGEQGSMLLEAVVVMFVITLTVSGIIGVQTAIAKSADKQQIQTAVDQRLNGILEEASSLPWASITTCRASLVAVPVVGTSITSPVQATLAECPTPGIQEKQTVEVDGREVTITTNVEWVLATVTTTPPVDDGAYGRKRIIVSAEWTNHGAGQASQAQVVSERVPALDEVSPR